MTDDEALKYIERTNHFEKEYEYIERVILGDKGTIALGKIVPYDKTDTQELIDLLLTGKCSINITKDGIGISRELVYSDRTRIYFGGEKKSETFETIRLNIQCPFLSACQNDHGGCVINYGGSINTYKDLRDNSLYNGTGVEIRDPYAYFKAIKREWTSCNHYSKEKVEKNSTLQAYANEIDRLIDSH